MHPPALVRASIDGVATKDVAHEVNGDLPAQDAPTNVLATAQIIVVGADGVLPWGADRSDGARPTVLPPPGLVAMPDRTVTCLLVAGIFLVLTGAPHLMQQFNNFTDADSQLVQRAQGDVNTAHRDAQHQGEGGDQAGKPPTDTTLTNDLPGQVECRATPALAGGTPALDDLMLNDLTRLWER